MSSCTGFGRYSSKPSSSGVPALIGVVRGIPDDGERGQVAAAAVLGHAADAADQVKPSWPGIMRSLTTTLGGPGSAAPGARPPPWPPRSRPPRPCAGGCRRGQIIRIVVDEEDGDPVSDGFSEPRRTPAERVCGCATAREGVAGRRARPDSVHRSTDCRPGGREADVSRIGASPAKVYTHGPRRRRRPRCPQGGRRSTRSFRTSGSSSADVQMAERHARHGLAHAGRAPGPGQGHRRRLRRHRRDQRDRGRPRGRRHRRDPPPSSARSACPSREAVPSPKPPAPSGMAKDELSRQAARRQRWKRILSKD